jgi:putative membrane protein
MIGKFLTFAVSLEHFYIAYIEMFMWNTPTTNAIFGLKNEKEFAGNPKTKIMAANQGLYNGFLAIGSLWASVYPDPAFSYQLSVFFTSCVAVAAIFGAASTGNTKILKSQGSPAFLALTALYLGI